jgi:hypothetical protein
LRIFSLLPFAVPAGVLFATSPARADDAGAPPQSPAPESQPEGAPAPDEADLSSPHPLTAVAPTPQPAETAQSSSIVPKFATGFVTFTAAATSVSTARPRSEFDYSGQAAGGIAATGTPFEKWTYLAYITLGAGADSVTGVSGSISPEQITLAFAPVEELTLQAGYMRIPFSVAAAAVITNVMFPARPQATELFQSGADAGFLAGYEHAKGYLKVKVGLFDGLSLGLTLPNYVTRGGVLSGWVDVAPFGKMPPLEGDTERGPFRMAIGGGVLYRPEVVYDIAGYQGVHIADVRVSAALRIAVAGLFLQGEYLQDIQRDDLSDRPRIARGTYGQGSFYVPIKPKVAFAPITRLGWSVQDEGFFPLRIVSFDTGLAFYPRGDISSPGSLRIVLEYLSERHVDEGETAYGALASALMHF